jgi:hypothetical protein
MNAAAVGLVVAASFSLYDKVPPTQLLLDTTVTLYPRGGCMSHALSPMGP